MVRPYARYFYYRHQSNWHCSPCPSSYRGHNNQTTKTNLWKDYILRINGWRRPAWERWYRRAHTYRYCSSYKFNNYKMRTVHQCGQHVRRVAPDAKYFIFKSESNWHCAACPPWYDGTTRGTSGSSKSIEFHIYQIRGWREKNYGWKKWLRRVARHRYCTGYKKTAYNHRTVEACANWVKSIDDEARYFFYRQESNWHCSPCPLTYRGGSAGTSVSNTRIYVYRILNWRPPAYFKWYRRIARMRYCTGYKKSAFNHRSVENCANWVKSVDKEARWFFFRHQSNWHCSPCPLTYRGHPTTGTAYQNSRIFIYRIIHWKAPTYEWSKWYRRVAYQRHCHGYRQSNYKLRSVIQCANWVRKVDDEARYFFFKEEGNFHCAPCPLTYTGGNGRTGYSKTVRVYIYRILNWRPPAWTKFYKRITKLRYCTGYMYNNYKFRNVMDCGRYIQQKDREVKYFFFRQQSNWHCAACPDSYTGHPTTGTGYSNTRIYTYRIINWRRPIYSWRHIYRRVTHRRYCHGYKKSIYSHRTVENCGAWVRKVDPEARFFFFREQSNWHCSPCPLWYRGGNANTHAHNSRIYVYRILNWKRPSYTWWRWYRRIATHRYCSGYRKTATNHRTVEACGKWVRLIAPYARFFFFRHQSNWHCSPCPASYRGHPTSGTVVDKNTRIFIYGFRNWTRPVWEKDYKRISNNRYCTGYKKSAFNHRSVVACANWVKGIDKEARWFFFRHEGNYHCSPCPMSYRGHPTTGTARQNSEIYIYRIVGWKAPTYGW
jgi:hypothetical protein